MRTAPARRSHADAARVVLVLGGTALACASLAGGEKAIDPIDVESHQGWVTIRADAAPLADLLQRLSAVVGIKVVYGGAPPHEPVTVDLKRQSPADAVVALLAGQGMDFALQPDASGAPTQTLFVAGARDSDSTATNDSPAGVIAASLDETDPPTPAEEEVDEPENPIDLPEVDPLAVPETEPAEVPAASEPTPTATPSPTPSAVPWSGGLSRSPFAPPTPLPATPRPPPPDPTPTSTQ